MRLSVSFIFCIIKKKFASTKKGETNVGICEKKI